MKVQEQQFDVSAAAGSNGVLVQIGERVYEVSPLPLRFVTAKAKELDRFKLPPLAPGAQPQEGAEEPMTDKERLELMYQGLVASIRRKQPDLDTEQLLDDLDHETIVRAWVVVMENSTVRGLLGRKEPGKDRLVLTTRLWDEIQGMPTGSPELTGNLSSPESSPAPAGV